MKKTMVILAAVLMLCIVFCACGKSAEPAPTPTPIIIYVTPSPTPSSAPIVTAAPQTAAPIVTPVPTSSPQIVVKVPQITKNPTSESVSEGGNATFIARADNYSYMYWQIVSQDGRVAYNMNEAPWYFQGLSVNGDGGTQLVLCNCPLSLDGWCVQAVFVGSGTPVISNRAYISVSRAPKAQLWAYPSSGYFEYSDQAIQLNAGPGDQIHYELTYNGNTYTGNVTSGGCCYIGAIENQRYDVYLYAYVVGDPSNAISCQYVMDCLPAWDDQTPAMTQSMIDAINNGTYDEDTNYLDDLVIPEGWTPPQ